MTEKARVYELWRRFGGVAVRVRTFRTRQAAHYYRGRQRDSEAMFVQGTDHFADYEEGVTEAERMKNHRDAIDDALRYFQDLGDSAGALVTSKRVRPALTYGAVPLMLHSTPSSLEQGLRHQIASEPESQ